jgi:hypothetical protein
MLGCRHGWESRTKPRPTVASDDCEPPKPSLEAARTLCARDAAETLAAERLSGLMAQALDRLERLLESEDDVAAARAVREVFDRVLGRSLQRQEHSGAVTFGLEIQAAAEDARTKLAELIDRRANAIAAERAA